MRRGWRRVRRLGWRGGRRRAWCAVRRMVERIGKWRKETDRQVEAGRRSRARFRDTFVE
jgi:hypothetical protein